jgi:hypothetical protein
MFGSRESSRESRGRREETAELGRMEKLVARVSRPLRPHPHGPRNPRPRRAFVSRRLGRGYRALPRRDPARRCGEEVPTNSGGGANEFRRRGAGEEVPTNSGTDPRWSARLRPARRCQRIRHCGGGGAAEEVLLRRRYQRIRARRCQRIRARTPDGAPGFAARPLRRPLEGDFDAG